jgi:hypothetical protein
LKKLRGKIKRPGKSYKRITIPLSPGRQRSVLGFRFWFWKFICILSFEIWILNTYAEGFYLICIFGHCQFRKIPDPGG